MQTRTANETRQQLDELPVVDVHTHLGRNWQAGNLAQIVSYHWLEVELKRAAGGPFEANPQENPEDYIRQVLPHFPAIRNTSNHYACMRMLHDLYGLEGRTLTPENWEAVDRAVRERAADPSWVRRVTDRAGVKKVLAMPGNVPEPPERFVPYAYGEPYLDVHSPRLLRELAGEDNEQATGPGQLRDQIQTRIRRTVEEQHIRALHVWPRGSWEYEPVGDDRIGEVLAGCCREKELSARQENALQSFCADAAADAAGRHGLVVQIFHGSADYADCGHSSHWNPGFIRAFARHVARHPGVRYDLFLGTRIPGHEAVSIARSHPNLMVRDRKSVV